MKRLSLIFSLFCHLYAVSSWELPQELIIHERYFCLTTTFDVYAENGSHGKIVKKFLSLTPQYTYKDRQDNVIAKATAHFFSWGVTADVVDGQEQKIGTIEEKVFTLSPCEFRIINKNNQIVATARMNFWRTHFLIKDMQGNQIALLRRPLLRFYVNKWNLYIIDDSYIKENELDPRLLMMCAVYRVDSERKYARQRQFSKQGTKKDRPPYLHTLSKETQKIVHKTQKRLLKYSIYSNQPLNLSRDMALAQLDYGESDNEQRFDDPISLGQLEEMRSANNDYWVRSVMQIAQQTLEDPRVPEERKGAIYRLLNAFVEQLYK